MARIDSVVDVHNPLDLTPMTGDAAYEDVVRAVLEADGVDVGLVGCVPLTAALNTLPAGAGHREDLAQADVIALRLARLKDELPKAWVAVVDAGAIYDPLARSSRARRPDVPHRRHGAAAAQRVRRGAAAGAQAARRCRAVDGGPQRGWQPRTRHDSPLPEPFTPPSVASFAGSRTPPLVQRYLNSLPYNTEPPPGGPTLRSFRGVVRTGDGALPRSRRSPPRSSSSSTATRRWS